MQTAVFSAKPYDRRSLDAANAQYGHELTYYETRLNALTAPLAAGYPAVSVFVNDDVDAGVIEALAAGGTRLIATRSAGFNQIDLEAAARHGITVTRVPAYSPSAVSEFTVGLMLMLARQMHRGHQRVRQNNFELEGLQGFELRGKTVGVLGTGKIGANVAVALKGFGCTLLAYDLYPSPQLEDVVRYVEMDEIWREADIITLHVPLTPETYHLIDAETIVQLKPGVMLVNTSRGALLDTPAVIEGLKSGRIGFLAIDVYEEEEDLFFEDMSSQVVKDDVFARLLTFHNVVVTAHQAFFSDEALANIADATLAGITEFEKTGTCTHAVTAG